MARITLKQIRIELEKLKTLDEKKQYLESLLGKTKSPKLKTKLQKLLDEVSKHIEEHEKKLTTEIPLEEKLGSTKEAMTEILSGSVPEIKYVPRKEMEVSPLEKEVARQPFFGTPTATVGIKYEPPSTAYDHQRTVESLRFYLSEQQHLVDKFTPETLERMPDEKKRQVFGIIQQSLGLSEITGAEDYTRIMNYMSNVFSIEKPSGKYKTKT